MIKLRKMQEQKQQQAAQQQAGDGSAPANGGGGVFTLKKEGAAKAKPTVSAAELRAQKDISEMDPIPGAKLEFPNKDDLLNFTVNLRPTDGLFKGAEYQFEVKVPYDYPYTPPKVKCLTPIYHPNINEEGAVCLNILRQDWKPVLTLGSVIIGLMTLFLEPNPADPLNHEAAKLMTERPQEYERTVKRTLAGGTHFGRSFPKLL
eukprot:TRINITY_DN9300_c0_g1_i1.p1 TRINITY_DN9300_c0_g1~~TRINITY_DN9300_c0_g1_i1.p1  ORF type:complete len:204 (-),score=65.94 TRINITY_DN9300_c0_g1_i1:74-685(-)